VCVLSRGSRGSGRAAAGVGRAGRVDRSYVGVGDRGRLSRDCVHLACRDAVEHNRFCAGKRARGTRRRASRRGGSARAGRGREVDRERERRHRRAGDRTVSHWE
jgi:hypothetical protein